MNNESITLGNTNLISRIFYEKDYANAKCARKQLLKLVFIITKNILA